MATIFTTGEIAYPHYGVRSYRIEHDLGDGRRQFQRHIWTLENGEVETARWISSFVTTEAELRAGGYFPAPTVPA